MPFMCSAIHGFAQSIGKDNLLLVDELKVDQRVDGFNFWTLSRDRCLTWVAATLEKLWNI
jgi:hypothetical protein